MCSIVGILLEPDRNLLSIIQDGGVLMIPILVCSFVLMVFLFERTISLRRGRVIPEPFVKRFLHQMREGQLDREQALRLCDESRSAVAAVFAGGIRKWGRPAAEVERAIVEAGERAVNELRRFLRVFNGVATVGPLLGLLGTVFGMIQCFNEIAGADAMGRPELLAGGISQALLTTAAGLTIAIPALICYMFFLGRVDRLTIELDSLGEELANLISAEALECAPRTKTMRVRRQEAA
jgi:biopolymer transport protein ExbB